MSGVLEVVMCPRRVRHVVVIKYLYRQAHSLLALENFVFPLLLIE